MTNAELDEKIAEAMTLLRADNLQGAINKAWNDYVADIKDEARKTKKKKEKLADAVERLMESNSCELYCYIMFSDQGNLRGWTIEHQQYWQGNDGPTSAIPIGGGSSYEEIEREIGNDLAEALDIED